MSTKPEEDLGPALPPVKVMDYMDKEPCGCCGRYQPLSNVRTTYMGGPDVVAQADLCFDCKEDPDCWPGQGCGR